MPNEFQRLVPTEVRDNPDGSITIVASPPPTMEKLHTVATAAARLLPVEWKVECVGSTFGNLPADDPALWHSFYAGTDDYGQPLVRVPCPDTPGALFIYLHEMGHVILGHVWEKFDSFKEGVMIFEVELIASLWAYSFMRAYGLEVPVAAKALAIGMARLQAQDGFMPKPAL